MARWTGRFDRLARDTSCRDHYLLTQDTYTLPLRLLRYGYEMANGLGVDLRVQRNSSPRANYGVALAGDLTLLPHSWDRLPDYLRAELLLHELVHNRQWRKYRLFGLRWALSARFRAAMELQAYRESISAFVLMGIRRDWVMEWVIQQCRHFPETYRTKQVRVNIASYLLDAFEEAEDRLKGCS